MTAEQLNALRSAVRARLDVVADHTLRDADPAAHLAKLRSAAAHLEALVGTLPPSCDPMLRHFLERQSYLKAREWLDGAIGPHQQ
jgi:hypothetical protein